MITQELAMQAYSSKKRESDPHSLPNVEAFEVNRKTRADECPLCMPEHPTDYDVRTPADDIHDRDHCGWYWRACFPGCLPDSDAFGPFDTQAAALADAQDGADSETDDDDEPDDEDESYVSEPGDADMEQE